MGSCDDGNDPAALVQTRRSGSRVHGSDQDIVALIVPGGTGATAQFDLVGLRAPHLASLVRADRELQRLTSQVVKVGPSRLTGCRAPGGAHQTDIDGVRTTSPDGLRIMISLGYGCIVLHLKHKIVCFGRFFRLMNNSG